MIFGDTCKLENKALNIHETRALGALEHTRASSPQRQRFCQSEVHPSEWLHSAPGHLPPCAEHLQEARCFFAGLSLAF